MRPLRSLIVPCAIIAVVPVAACANPRAEANVAQALSDAANEINGLKNDIAQLQTDVDSLKQVVARQDSTITHIVATMPK
jgi:outer membrane murein-binding lipoprotein Lpp